VQLHIGSAGSAELHSAVSPTSSRQGIRRPGNIGIRRAIETARPKQIKDLRYGRLKVCATGHPKGWTPNPRARQTNDSRVRRCSGTLQVRLLLSERGSRLYTLDFEMNPAIIVPKLLTWFERHARKLPWRETRDPYAIWVSEIMLQQTQVNTVRRFWERWMRALPDVRALAEANPQKLHKLWEGLGYYTRVRNLHKAAQVIIKNHGGRFPKEFEEVLALPGIGRYTAGAVCSIAFNQSRPILDGNVMRVLTRLEGIHGDPRKTDVNKRLWQMAEELVLQAGTNNRARACSQLNQSLMELGALLCTPKRPQCGRCPLTEQCVARRDGLVERLPELKRRVPTTRRRFASLVVEHRGRFLVRQRPAHVVNAHLWEFPNLEILPVDSDSELALRVTFRLNGSPLAPWGTIQHTITRYRITLEVFRLEVRSKQGFKFGQWLTLPQLRQLPFSSAHKKILERAAAATVTEKRRA
jgi:A/G-specific adenine glycosylase